MRSRLTLAALVLVALAAGGAGTAQAKPSASDKPGNHGQCVSSSPQPDSKGGRSVVAKNRSTCTPQLACEVIGDVRLDSARNTVAVTDADPAGSALQCAADIAVTAGDLITFDYTIENGSCGGGIPRIYVVIGGTFYNTFDDQPGQCGVGGSVTYAIPATGTVTEVGFVSDSRTGLDSTVTYRNAKIDGVTLNI